MRRNSRNTVSPSFTAWAHEPHTIPTTLPRRDICRTRPEAKRLAVQYGANLTGLQDVPCQT